MQVTCLDGFLPHNQRLVHIFLIIIATIADIFAVIGRTGVQTQTFPFQGTNGGQTDLGAIPSSACLQQVPWASHGTPLSPILFTCKIIVSTLQAVLSGLKINGNKVSRSQLVLGRWP